MSDYRRWYQPGGNYFLTLVTHQRKKLLVGDPIVNLLRESVQSVATDLPFEAVAGVVLPDHIHVIWRLPSGDTNYSKRIGLLKVRFTRRVREMGHQGRIAALLNERGEATVWQRRFWEHTIHEEGEFEACMDYIHFNPVRHGYVRTPGEWPHSTFSKWVNRGVYPANWAAGDSACQQRLTGVERYAGE
jgi:putative transposase